ncbi:uncharacterized protein LOC110043794 [Orbicella faveolata]|uniref:uncharacterized protein LOC110043794 n=1 Tax=Orbicella faveolata TaxID=48498 RepID=UPI0009E39A62|nr:uncharacterized protein LOC110043794 [Orbicella faveolata]
MAALNKAICERRFKQVRSFIDLGVNFNWKDRDGKTALIQLCSVEPDSLAISIASRLLKRGAKIDVTDSNGLSALSTAVVKQKEDMVALFLEEAGNFDLNSKDKKGNTALFHAAKVGNFNILNAIVIALQKYQLSVNVPNNEGTTPLIQACMNGDIVCARFLIKEGKAAMNNRDWIHRKTALEWAKIKGIEESILLSNADSSHVGNKMNEKLPQENHYQRRQLQCLEKGDQPENGFTGRTKWDKTYKDQFLQVYRIYECQLTASFKQGRKPKTKILESTEEDDNAKNKTTIDSPKGRGAFKVLKRNSTNNISRPFPFQNLQRSQSFTEFTKLSFRDSERHVYSPPFPRSRSPLSTRSRRVRQQPSGSETRSVLSGCLIPTVFETNELDE